MALALALTGVFLQLPPSRNPPSIPLSRHLVRPGHLSQLRLRPRPLSISLSATAVSAFFSASAAPPLTSRRSQDVQPLDQMLETDGAGLNGGSHGTTGGGAVGDHDGDSNRKAALMVPPRDDWPPVDPETEDQAAIVPGSEGSSSNELEKLPLLRQLEGLKQRPLADGLFLLKVTIESGQGIFNKNFFKEPEIVFADAVMAVVADFMLVHLLPAPTAASLPPVLLAKFFHGCPGNAFQIALPGSSYSLAQRLGALALNGGKLFAVGAASSMVRTVVRNALIDARKVAGKSSRGDMENVQILSTGLACGVYMAISNLRSQVLDGVVEQRILEPLLHQHKFMLSAIRFAVRTGNTFLGSRLWIDYARWVGIQK